MGKRCMMFFYDGLTGGESELEGKDIAPVQPSYSAVKLDL